MVKSLRHNGYCVIVVYGIVTHVVDVLIGVAVGAWKEVGILYSLDGVDASQAGHETSVEQVEDSTESAQSQSNESVIYPMVAFGEGDKYTTYMP